MIRRVVAVAIPLLCAGCANEPVSAIATTEPSGLGAARPDPEHQTTTGGEAAAATHRKNMASKVLSAIAFERVTGLKADPARLVAGD